MSGGYFDYNNYRMHDIAEDIGALIDTNGCTEPDAYRGTRGRNYPPEIIEKFAEAKELIHKAGNMAYAIDYLVSGDYGYECFLKKWEQITTETK